MKRLILFSFFCLVFTVICHAQSFDKAQVISLYREEFEGVIQDSIKNASASDSELFLATSNKLLWLTQFDSITDKIKLLEFTDKKKFIKQLDAQLNSEFSFLISEDFFKSVHKKI